MSVFQIRRVCEGGQDGWGGGEAGGGGGRGGKEPGGQDVGSLHWGDH